MNTAANLNRDLNLPQDVLLIAIIVQSDFKHKDSFHPGDGFNHACALTNKVFNENGAKLKCWDPKLVNRNKQEDRNLSYENFFMILSIRTVFANVTDLRSFGTQNFLSNT
jgi:hypothetical protein